MKYKQELVSIQGEDKKELRVQVKYFFSVTPSSVRRGERKGLLEKFCTI
jgi:hypothetical protein